MEKISVVIPVYNVEKYLEKCVDSVLRQTFDNFEIILVDDGSPDCCPAICDELATLDPRIRVIHKENGGLSSARNAGTDAACGDFIFYLDSDDYLENCALSSVLDVQKETSSDVVVGNYFYTYEDHEDLATLDLGTVIQLSNAEAMEQLVIGKIQTFAWGKLIRREIAQKYSFPVGKLFEDHFWTHLIFAEAEKVTVIDKPLVHYIQRNESISYRFDLERLDILDGWRARREFLSEYYPNLLTPFFEVTAHYVRNLAWICLTKMSQNKMEALRILRIFSQENTLPKYTQKDDLLLLKSLHAGIGCYLVCALFSKLKERLKRIKLCLK